MLGDGDHSCFLVLRFVREAMQSAEGPQPRGSQPWWPWRPVLVSARWPSPSAVAAPFLPGFVVSPMFAVHPFAAVPWRPGLVSARWPSPSAVAEPWRPGLVSARWPSPSAVAALAPAPRVAPAAQTPTAEAGPPAKRPRCSRSTDVAPRVDGQAAAGARGPTAAQTYTAEAGPPAQRPRFSSSTDVAPLVDGQAVAGASGQSSSSTVSVRCQTDFELRKHCLVRLRIRGPEHIEVKEEPKSDSEESYHSGWSDRFMRRAGMKYCGPNEFDK